MKALATNDMKQSPAIVHQVDDTLKLILTLTNTVENPLTGLITAYRSQGDIEPMIEGRCIVENWFTGNVDAVD